MASRAKRGPVEPASGAGALLQLIRTGAAVTRAELVRASGLSRSTVTGRVDALLANGLVRERRAHALAAGRPPGVLELDPDGGVMLVAEMGAHETRVAVSDLAGEVLGAGDVTIDLADGTKQVLERVEGELEQLLADLDRAPSAVRGVGIAVPRSLSPGADGAPGTWPHVDGLERRYGGMVLVDDAVGMMALGEHRRHWPMAEHLLYIDVSAAISCGIVSGMRITHGADGVAGAIGHLRVGGDAPCGCGNAGCLDAVASGRAIVERLAGLGLPVACPADIVELVEANHGHATRALRSAGRHIGDAVAVVVSLFAPDVVVLGGELGAAYPPLLAGVRERVAQRTRARTTRSLHVAPSQLGRSAATTGIAMALIEQILAPEAVDAVLAVGVPRAAGKPRQLAVHAR